MPKYNIFVVSPNDVNSLISALENPASNKPLLPTHEYLADTHKVEVDRLTSSTKMMFRFADLKEHLLSVENTPVNNQVLSAYLRESGYSKERLRAVGHNSQITVWKHNKNSFNS